MLVDKINNPEEANMLQKENKQKDFFDSYVYERLLPDKHILLDIKKNINFSFVEEETNQLYSNSMGRPSFPPTVLFKILFLEFFYSLSDYEAVEQVKTNVLFRYFVGLGISQDTPDDTTLVVFRNRLGEENFKRLFDRVVIKAKEMGIIEGGLKIVDATHIQADVALEGAVNFLRQGRKMACKKISKDNPKQSIALKEKYVNEAKTYGPPTNDEIKEELNITRDFIKEARGKYGPEAEELMDLLKTAVSQQQRKADDPKHREPDEIISFTDEDARFGYKSDKKKFAGYKAHASLDETSGIVTSARTITGNRNEGANHEVKRMLKEDKSKDIAHQAVAADSLYDSYENRRNIHKQSMRAFIPSRTKTRKKRPHLDNFIYDQKNDTLMCPEGHSPISKTEQEQGTLYIFSTRQCRNCPSIQNCPTPNYDRIRVFVSNDYRSKLVDNIPGRKEAFMRRKAIERKFGEVKKWHGLHRARYRKRWRVAIQVFMTFMVVNIKRMVTLSYLTPEFALCKTGFG